MIRNGNIARLIFRRRPVHFAYFAYGPQWRSTQGRRKWAVQDVSILCPSSEIGDSTFSSCRHSFDEIKVDIFGLAKYCRTSGTHSREVQPLNRLESDVEDHNLLTSLSATTDQINDVRMFGRLTHLLHNLHLGDQVVELLSRSVVLQHFDGYDHVIIFVAIHVVDQRLVVVARR
uniref:Uncharacterized protein n=1 Tax=Romanomermis culicivorax TaxID=13658 RepID=A0A915HQM3_ROMCU